MIEIIAAVIAAVGAVLSAMFASHARTFARDVDRIQNAIDDQDKKRGAFEGDFWKIMQRMPESYLPRAEHELFRDLVRDLQNDVRSLRADLKRDTEEILKAVRQARNP